MADLQPNLVLIFFIYGLAFFSMGLALVLETNRSPGMAEARVLWPLAAFGFVHGTHEWLEMTLLVRQWFGLEVPGVADVFRLGMLIVSFVLLLSFGLQVLNPTQGRLGRLEWLLGGILPAAYTVIVISTSLIHRATWGHWLLHADIFARYLLAVPGAGIAALALNRQARQVHASGQRALALHFRLAAFGFAVYSLTQLFVSPADIFLSASINTATFIAWTGFPIQAVRAAMAVLITYGLIRATQMADNERRRQFVAVQNARLEALELVQRETLEREALRRELLRHTVTAQEEERTRIARELHDETAQFLTAMTLNMATVRSLMPNNPKIEALLDRLQVLSRQMSQGIYRMVRDLRPAQLDDLGLVAAIQYLVDEERKQTGIEVNLVLEGERERLDPLVETVLFRVAQEALTNVSRHAQSDRAGLRLAFYSGQVMLEVCDEGVGFDPEDNHTSPHGWGLVGMRERLESVGGELEVESSPGQGTRLRAKVPFRERETPHIEEVQDEHDSDHVGG